MKTLYIKLNYRLSTSMLIVIALITFENTWSQDCKLDFDWKNYNEIKIYIHPDLAENLLHENGSVWTDDELLHEIHYVVETLQEQLPTGAPPFVVKGFSSGKAWNDKISNSVHVVPWLGECEVGCNCRATAWVEYGGGGPKAGLLLGLKRSQDGRSGDRSLGIFDCGKRWEHFTLENSPVHSLRGILNHELMHVYGLGHYNDPDICNFIWNCQETPCACLDGNENDQADNNNCYFWDWWNLKEIYGHYPAGNNQIQLGTLNGTDWWQEGDMPESAPLFGVSTSTNSPFLIINNKDREHQLQSLQRFTPGPDIYDNFGSTTPYTVIGRVGVAHNLSDSFDLYTSSTEYESFAEVRKKIRLVKADDLFNIEEFETDFYRTRMQGVSVAHDPKNNVLVFAFRTSSSQVAIQFFNGEEFEDPIVLTGQFSGDTPSVTCGNGDIAKNCIITWSDAATDPGIKFRTLRWRHFATKRICNDEISTDMVSSIKAIKIDNPKIDLCEPWKPIWGPIMNYGYIMYGPPSVAFIGPSESRCSFVFAWKNPGKSFFTVCKSSIENSTLTSGTERRFTINAGRVMSPQIGGVNSVNMRGAVLNIWK